jgi:hypothetical protein
MIASAEPNAPMVVGDLFSQGDETSATEQAPQRNRMKCRFDDQILPWLECRDGAQDRCEWLLSVIQIATNIQRMGVHVKRVGRLAARIPKRRLSWRSGRCLRSAASSDRQNVGRWHACHAGEISQRKLGRYVFAHHDPREFVKATIIGNETLEERLIIHDRNGERCLGREDRNSIHLGIP